MYIRTKSQNSNGNFFSGSLLPEDDSVATSLTTAIPPLARRDWRATRCAQRIGPQPRNALRSPPVTTCIEVGRHGPIPHRIAPVFLPATHKGDRQPLHEGRQLAIALRPQKQVPVVGHHRVRTNPHRRLIKSILQNLLECLVVGRFLEQLHSRHAAIQDVKNHSTRSYPRCPWHHRSIIQNSPSCQYRTCPAFSVPPCQYRTCPAFSVPFRFPAFRFPPLSVPWDRRFSSAWRSPWSLRRAKWPSGRIGLPMATSLSYPSDSIASHDLVQPRF